MTDPQHPGWSIWERLRAEELKELSEMNRRRQAAGLPPAPQYQALAPDPGPEHLDRLIQREIEQEERAKVFEYTIVTWRKLGIKQILARRNVRGAWETVLFNAPTGTWIWDPTSGAETMAQVLYDEDPYIQAEPATREEAEALAQLKGTTLPTPERLLEMCRNQEGRALGMSATPEDRAGLRDQRR